MKNYLKLDMVSLQNKRLLNVSISKSFRITSRKILLQREVIERKVFHKGIKSHTYVKEGYRFCHDSSRHTK